MTRLIELLSPLAHHPAVMGWSLAFVMLGKVIRGSKWLYVLFVLPGTVLHEASHLSVGWVLGAKPSRFSVMPKQNGRELTLGSVGFSRLTWWNALPIGIAPLLLIPLALLIILCAARYGFFSLESAGLGYLTAQCVMGCLPSSTDLNHAGKSAAIYALIGGVSWLLFHFATRYHVVG